MRRLWTGTAVLALSLSTAASSMAATATRVLKCDRYHSCADLLNFTAEVGETNVVTVAVAQDGVVIRDPAGIQAGTGCVQVNDHAVSCAPSGGASSLAARFDLRDRDDVLDARATPGSTRIDGGRGDDQLLGPLDHFGDFIGGSGDDRMVGGTETDQFSEGRSANGSDTMLGGAGSGSLGADRVSYAQRRRGVHVDAQGDRDDGAPGERDRVVGVEAVVGGFGDDVLTGGPDADYLNGMRGRDQLRGRGGDDDLDGGDPRRWSPAYGPVPRTGDTIFGGDGADRIDGGLGPDRVNAGHGRDWIGTGAGRDRVLTRDGEVDVALCGAGRPDMASHDRIDFIESCERHDPLHVEAVPLLWADPPDSLSLLLGCPLVAPCSGRIVVTRGGTVLGEAPFSLRADSHGFVYVNMPGRGTQSLEDATVTVVSETGYPETTSEDFPLRDVCHGPRCFVAAVVD
jgi:hypothetical protein